MRVYHFTSAKYGLDNIRNRRLKISRVMELNDPFEFLGVDLTDRNFRNALKKTKKEISKTKGILCFSKTWRNPVLWGHYADKHKGFCLGFDVNNTILGKVKYVDARHPRPSVLDDNFMKNLLFTKFSHWRYEQEYRVYVELEDENDGLYYSDFSNQLALKQVIVGDQSKVTRAQVSDALGALNNDVESFKARAGFKDFEVVRNRNRAMWN